ncbi:MAG TPA: hypothetical protein VGQ78_05070, partial [Vicinamibacteria bacterium]|nr:hypothetical protein [Vicinamibacteria bacterium]
MKKHLLIVGIFALVLASFGLKSSLEWLGALLLAGGLGTIGARTSAEYATFLLIANGLDAIAYVGLAFVGLGLIGDRAWARRAGLYVGGYLVGMMTLQVVCEWVFVVEPGLAQIRITGQRVRPLGVAAALAVHFVGAVATVTLGCVLLALARGAPPSPPPRRPAAILPTTGGSRSLAWRAAVALGLMAGFYGLAIAIALGLVWIPYAEFRYSNRLH